MPRPFTPVNGDDLIRRYQAGESLKALADECGVGRTSFTGFLHRNGIPIRGTTEANRLIAAAKTPEQHAAGVRAAHDALRGRRQPAEQRARIAAAKEISGKGASPAELLLAEWLLDLDPIPQKAVGPYNIDLAVGAVAVEIFGGHWHAHGRHAARTQERVRYLLDQGWLLVIVWVTGKHRLQRGVADYVRAHHDLARRDPTVRGQYRVVWGDGEDATAACADLDQIALVPAISRGANSGA